MVENQIPLNEKWKNQLIYKLDWFHVCITWVADPFFAVLTMVVSIWVLDPLSLGCWRKDVSSYNIIVWKCFYSRGANIHEQPTLKAWVGADGTRTAGSDSIWEPGCGVGNVIYTSHSCVPPSLLLLLKLNVGELGLTSAANSQGSNWTRGDAGLTPCLLRLCRRAEYANS